MVSNNLQLSLALFSEFFLPVLNEPHEDTRTSERAVEWLALGSFSLHVRKRCIMGRFLFFWFLVLFGNDGVTVICVWCMGLFLRTNDCSLFSGYLSLIYMNQRANEFYKNT